MKQKNGKTIAVVKALDKNTENINPRLFNHSTKEGSGIEELMIEKSGVDNSSVQNSGIEMSCNGKGPL